MLNEKEAVDMHPLEDITSIDDALPMKGPLKSNRHASIAATIGTVRSKDLHHYRKRSFKTMKSGRKRDLFGEAHHSHHHWSMVDPTKPFRRMWDVLITIFVLYLVVTVPLSIAFGSYTMKQSFYSGFGWFLEVFFWCDILLNFRTGFVHAGHVEYNQWEIVKHYLLIDPPGCHSHHDDDHGKKKTWVGYIPKGWFIVDFIASFPFNMIISDTGTQKNSKKGRKAVKFFKIFKLTKLLRLGRIIRQMPDYFKYRLVFYCLFFLVVASHMLACVWISIQGIDIISERPFGFQTDDLVSNGFVSPTKIYLAALDGAILQLFLVSDSPILLGAWSKFNKSLGEGSVWEETSGKTVYSHILSIIICLLGGLLQSLIWALVYKLVTNQSTMRERFRKKMDHMTEEMETLKFPQTLQHQVTQYYKLLWNQPNFYGNSPSSEYITTDLDLCHTLKVKLARHLTGLIPEIHDIELFKGCSDECLGVIVNKMRAHYFVTGNVIWEKDTAVRELIYIYKGEIIDVLDLQRPDLDSKICHLKFYGEEQLLGRVDVKFGRYLVAHSEVVQVAVFPKALIVEVFTQYQQKESILFELQKYVAVDDKPALLDRTPAEIKDNSKKAVQFSAQPEGKGSDDFSRSTTRRIETTEKRLDAIELNDNQIFENVKRLEDWTSKMDTKMENVIQFINKLTQQKSIVIP